MRRRNPNSWTVVPLPERDLSEVVFELVAPLLDRLGPAPAVDDARAAVALAVTFWNASVLASKQWEHPRVKELNALKKSMRGRAASREDAARFDLLAERWREHWLDPRLVESWTYAPDASGVPRLVCTMGLPEGVRAEVPPPAEKRVAIGGKFLDDVHIPRRPEARPNVTHGGPLWRGELSIRRCSARLPACGCPGQHVTSTPAVVPGRCESANLSQGGQRKSSESQCEPYPGQYEHANLSQTR